MKRMLILAVLFVLLLSTVGATAAVAKSTTVSGNVYPVAGYAVGAVLKGAKATFDTQSGAWTIKTTTAPPPAFRGHYYLAVSSSPPVNNQWTSAPIIATVGVGANGKIDQSGTGTTASRGDVDQAITHGGVFLLIPFSMP